MRSLPSVRHSVDLQRVRSVSRLAIVVALLASGVSPASAQFLRLGPLDFGARAGLEGIYTTNVEQERESESDADREDFYGILSFDLIGRGDVARSTRLNVDTGIAIEKHVNRPDLDNSESPFGRARIDSETEIGRLVARLFYAYEKTSDSVDDTFVPSGKVSKKRDVQSKTEYGGGLLWKRDPLAADFEYSETKERHDEEEFQIGDKDEKNLGYGASVRLRKNLGLSYKMERTKTILVNDPENEDWDDTQTITVDWYLQILERPQIRYSFGVEKEDTDEEEGEWEPIHTLTVKDDRQLSPTLHLALDAEYTYEDSPEEDDIGFTYGALLSHDISATARQAFRARREPVSTFGSTTETDSTEFGYNFEKRDLLVYNMTFSASVTYSIDKPLDGSSPEEKTWQYEATLSHTAAISRRLSRQLKYEYSLEESNLIEENLEEHRVSLLYTYEF
jgi:hypothetical protein